MNRYKLITGLVEFTAVTPFNLKVQAKKESLLLQQESENRYDEYPIAVFLQDLKLSFIPKANNAVVSQQLDRGQIVTTNINQL